MKVASLLVLLATLTFLWAHNTHRVGLWEPTEARYADIAWRMAETGDWLTPRLNTLEHFHKPAPAYWPAAAAFAVLGKHHWAARMSSLVLALLMTAVTFAWGRRMWGFRQGILAAAMLGTTVMVSAVARIVSSDLPLAVAVLFAQRAAWELLPGRTARPGAWAAVFWIALGAAFAVKGPPALLLGLVPVLVYGALARRGGDPAPLRRFGWTWGLPLFAALAFSWYGVMAVRHEGLAGYLIGQQVLGRTVSSVYGRPGPVYYFAAVLAGGFLPWSALLGWSLVRHLRRPRSLAGWPLWLASTWIPAFLVFSVAQSKLPAYILPLFPVWSLAAAHSLGEHPVPRAIIRATAALVALVGVGSIIAPHLPWLGSREWTGSAVGFLVGGVALLIGAAASVVIAGRGRAGWLGAMAAGWCVFLAMLGTELPRVAPRAGAVLEVGRRAREELARAPEASIITFHHVNSLSFYSECPIRTVGSTRERVFLDPTDASRLLLSPEASLDSLATRGTVLWVVDGEERPVLEERLGGRLTPLVREGPLELLRSEPAENATRPAR